ncbi:hypothetical protein K3495_g2594 [Podosphaera aphanis]|nr:hypothetical protein K3495_g2594 [Podosphaera aphanis]
MTELGTHLEVTTAYSSYQNGGSERSNRVILDKLRTLMVDQAIPDFLWPDLIRAVAHITNRTANRVFDKTSFEMFMDHIHPKDDNKPSIAHLRVLGCKAYVQIPKEKRAHTAKLALRAEVGILVGYEGNSIYRIYVPSRSGKKIIRSSHVRFDEHGYISDAPVEEFGTSVEGDTQIASEYTSQQDSLGTCGENFDQNDESSRPLPNPYWRYFMKTLVPYRRK